MMTLECLVSNPLRKQMFHLDYIDLRSIIIIYIYENFKSYLCVLDIVNPIHIMPRIDYVERNEPRGSFLIVFYIKDIFDNLLYADLFHH